MIGIALLAAGIASGSGRPPAKRVLFVVSAAKSVSMADGSSMEAGYWAGEFAVPARALLDAGFEIEVVTPGGAVPVPDTHSLRDGMSAAGIAEAFPALAKPRTLESLTPADAARFVAIVIPGGYSPMADLSGSKPLGALLRAAMEKKLVVAAICHGPAAFLSTRDGESWPFRGVKMTSFTDGEEREWLREKKLPWTVESSLTRAGVKFESASPWQSKVVRDGNVITGQSSPSTGAFTQTLLDALR